VDSSQRSSSWLSPQITFVVSAQARAHKPDGLPACFRSSRLARHRRGKSAITQTNDVAVICAGMAFRTGSRNQNKAFDDLDERPDPCNSTSINRGWACQLIPSLRILALIPRIVSWSPSLTPQHQVVNCIHTKNRFRITTSVSCEVNHLVGLLFAGYL
jgi:hypothetical protein